MVLTLKERELIIRWDAEGKRQERIADLLGCSQATVSRWISKHKSGRTLKTLPRSGRPTELSKKNLEKLKIKIIHEVKKANEKFCSLNTKQLSKIIEEEVGKKYSTRHVERIMHKLGFSLIKPRPKHIKQDPEIVAQFRDEFKKNFKRGTWIMSS